MSPACLIPDVVFYPWWRLSVPAVERSGGPEFGCSWARDTRNGFVTLSGTTRIATHTAWFYSSPRTKWHGSDSFGPGLGQHRST